MSVEISPETEARLTDAARKQGITVDALLERIVNERVSTAPSVQPMPELPIWQLGSIGSIHRRDIYEDAG